MPRSANNAQEAITAAAIDMKPQRSTDTYTDNGTDTAFSVVSSMTKDERIQSEYNRLLTLFDKVDPNKLNFVRAQVHELAYLNVSIVDLQADISSAGTMLQYSNGGGQEGYRQNPDLKTLVDFQKLTNSIVRVLLPLVPEKQEASDAVFFNCE